LLVKILGHRVGAVIETHPDPDEKRGVRRARGISVPPFKERRTLIRLDSEVSTKCC
jgi:hypothetical protein